MLEITDLPPQIVPAVNAFAQRLSNHIRSHRDASLEVHEQGVLDAWRAESAAVLGGVVTAATTGADPAARPPRSACPRCGGGRAAERWRRRTIETQLGGLTFTRTRYRCEVCRSEEHTSELQSHSDLVCRLLLEKKKIILVIRHP